MPLDTALLKTVVDMEAETHLSALSDIGHQEQELSYLNDFRHTRRTLTIGRIGTTQPRVHWHCGEVNRA